MAGTSRTILAHYGGAVLFTALAVLLRELLDPWLGDHLPLTTLYGAVALAVWFGGYRPALLAVVLGYLASDWLFINPRGRLGLDSARDLIGMSLYLLSCGMIIAFGEALQRARMRTGLSELEARRCGEQLQAVLDILPIGVAIAHDPDCRRITHNPYMSALLGVPAWANASLTAVENERPTNFTNCRNGVEVPTSELPMQLATTGLEVRGLELDLVVKGREPRAMLYDARPMFDEHGRVRGGVCVCLDVTERGRAEEELRRTTEQLRIVTESMAVPVTSCGRDLTYRWASKAYADLLNRPAREIIGKPIVDLLGPEAFERLLPRFDEVLSGKVVRYEEEVHYRGIGPRWISAVYTPTLGADGVPDGWVAVVNDITELRRQEKALRASEQRWRTMTEALPNLVWTDLPDGQCDWLSRQWGKYTGIPEDELLGLRWLETVVHPDDRERTLACWRAACADRSDYDLEYRIRRYDREYHWFKTRGVPIRDAEGKIVYWFGTCTDVEEFKRLEAELRQNRQLLADELEVMTRLHALSTRLLSAQDLTALEDVLENAVAACGADFGNIQLYNPETDGLEVVARRGFRQDFLDSFGLVRPEDGSARARALRSGERVVVEDVTVDAAFEALRPEASAAGFRAVQLTPLKGRDGSVLGILSTHFRIPHRPSERDERLLDLYCRHAVDLIERFRYEQALKDGDRRKDEFLATLAHELRNPLAPLRTGLEMMKLAKDDGAAVAKSRAMMERQLEQMVRLIDDLLDLSRINLGKIVLQSARIPLAAAVQNAVETSRPLIEQAGHELTLEMPDEPISVDADIMRLAQVFANLLNNAAKYTRRGGHIRLTAERQGSDVVVRVRDDGTGIPADKLPTLFEMFSQVERSLSRSQGGLGIGLHLVKRLVAMHGGSVTAHSDGPGRGSEFVVHLPAVMERSWASTPTQTDDPAAPASSLQILIVDDNQDAADSLAMLLRFMGNDIRTAYDGEEAVAAADEFRPDLVFLDIGLPKLDGYEACRRIRQQPWGTGMVLFATTGWGREEDRRRSHEAGFDKHLVKPIDPQTLAKLLAELNGVKHS